MRKTIILSLLFQIGDITPKQDILIWCDCSVGTVMTIADGGEIK